MYGLPCSPPATRETPVSETPPSLSYRAREWLKVNPETEAYVNILERALDAAEQEIDDLTTKQINATNAMLKAEARAREAEKDAERYLLLRANTGREYNVSSYGVPHALRITFDANGCERYLPDGAFDFPATLDAILDDEKKIRATWVHGAALARGEQGR